MISNDVSLVPRLVFRSFGSPKTPLKFSYRISLPFPRTKFVSVQFSFAMVPKIKFVYLFFYFRFLSKYFRLFSKLSRHICRLFVPNATDQIFIEQTDKNRVHTRKRSFYANPHRHGEKLIIMSRMAIIAKLKRIWNASKDRERTIKSMHFVARKRPEKKCKIRERKYCDLLKQWFPNFTLLRIA